MALKIQPYADTARTLQNPDRGPFYYANVGAKMSCRGSELGYGMVAGGKVKAGGQVGLAVSVATMESVVSFKQAMVLERDEGRPEMVIVKTDVSISGDVTVLGSFSHHTSISVSCLSDSSGPKKTVAEAKINVAINGFGRTGRNFIRCWHGRKDSPLDVIAINDTGGVKQATHLLKYDSMLGAFDADVKAVGDNSISVDGTVIKVVSDRNPLNLPWGVRERVTQSTHLVVHTALSRHLHMKFSSEFMAAGHT